MEQNKVDYLGCLLCNLQLINISEIIYLIAVDCSSLCASRRTADTKVANCFPIAFELCVRYMKSIKAN